MYVADPSVAGHTSQLHPWFVAARSSRDDAKRDWFIWADPGPDGGPPNNWVSEFGGPAGMLDERTGQYYLHIHRAAQKDLTWRNPAVHRPHTSRVRVRAGHARRG